jgi:beta-mannanase
MSWNGDPDVDNEYIQQTTGKLPALRGGDFLYQNTDSSGGTTTSRAQNWWNAGGISQLIYHMGNPDGDDSYNSAKTSCGSGCIGRAMTSGTKENGVLMGRLDHAATELGKLQAANVAVIWRPWHESNGGWFWWGMEGGGQFVALYKFEFDYFVKVKGLHNLVWEVSWAQNNPDSSWNPGAGVFDIAGPDTYASDSPFSGQYSNARSLVGSTVPISLQENGLMPEPSSMFNGNQAPWILFNTWTQFEYAPGNQYGANPTSWTTMVYGDSHTITRGQVPNLK